MNPMLVIAQSTIRELYRDRILYVLVFFGIVLILLSLLLSNLSIQENVRLTIDFGLAGIHLCMQVISVFVGSTLIFREIEKKSILFVMSYPISRFQFLMGKFIGFSVLLFGIVSVMLGILLFLLNQLGWSFHSSFLVAFLGIYIECILLLSLTFGLGSVAKPISVVIVCTGVFLSGHSLNSFRELAVKSKNEFYKFLSDFFEYIIPNLESMNWRSAVVYRDEVAINAILQVVGYAFFWILFFLVVAVSFFRRRDFV